MTYVPLYLDNYCELMGSQLFQGASALSIYT